MLQARFVPIEQWPGKKRQRHQQKCAAFKASYLQTLDKLESELEKLRASNILIQAYFTHAQVRNDGWPKTAAVPSESGVVLSFDSPKGPLSFPCDTYQTYDDNLRAIALSLEALRAVDRYGVTQGNEQYKGWARIEAPKPGRTWESAEMAARFIADHADGVTTDEVLNIRDMRTYAYRRAAAKLHPDNQQTGSHDGFVKLQAALARLSESA